MRPAARLETRPSIGTSSTPRVTKVGGWVVGLFFFLFFSFRLRWVFGLICVILRAVLQPSTWCWSCRFGYRSLLLPPSPFPPFFLPTHTHAPARPHTACDCCQSLFHTQQSRIRCAAYGVVDSLFLHEDRIYLASSSGLTVLFANETGTTTAGFPSCEEGQPRCPGAKPANLAPLSPVLVFVVACTRPPLTYIPAPLALPVVGRSRRRLHGAARWDDGRPAVSVDRIQSRASTWVGCLLRHPVRGLKLWRSCLLAYLLFDCLLGGWGLLTKVQRNSWFTILNHTQ